MTEERGLKALIDRLGARRRGGGFVEPKTGQMHTTPWAWRTPDSLYCGWDNSVWLYRAVDLEPWTWADDAEKIRYGARISEMMGELVGITPKGVLPQKMVDTNREFHMVSVTWWAPSQIPEANPQALREYQQSALRLHTAPRRALIVGVRLRPRSQQSTGEGASGVAKTIQALTLQVLGEDTPDLSPYARDYEEVRAILRRAGGRVPTRTEQYQLESWYNYGKGPEARMIEEWDHLLIEGFDQIQLAAVSDFHRPLFTAPHATWILDAMNHQAGPHVISVRGKLMPAAQARSKARSAIRWAMDQAEQEEKSGDVGRREVGDVYELANIFEDYFAESRYPLLSEVSVIMGRRLEYATETYVEELRNYYDIEVVPLMGRQLAALDETLPCSEKRVNPYPQEISTDMLAFSGISSFSALGDTEGVLIGVTAEDGVPVYVDPLGAPKANQPATMAVFGDSGSGKTIAVQNLATQAALAGLPVVVINPKGQDSLASFAELVDGQVVSMSRIEQRGGFFDPFRFTDPETAADIAATFLLSVLTELSERQQLVLRDGLRRGALEGGARCVGDALAWVNDPEIVEHVRLAATSEPRVGLGVAWEPSEKFEMRSRLTLVEFDKGLDLPEPGERPDRMSQRAALAAMQHVVRVSLEMLAGRTGGVLIVDEAWTFLQQAESRAALEGLGRKGRSLNVLPILATQKVADLLKYEMESLLSRVLCLSMRDPEEAAAALTLAGLEPTPARVQFLADCGPKRGADGRQRIPLAVHRDLGNRHGVIVLGPIPQKALDAFSTNPEDRRRRESEGDGENDIAADAGSESAWSDEATAGQNLEGIDEARALYESAANEDDVRRQSLIGPEVEPEGRGWTPAERERRGRRDDGPARRGEDGGSEPGGGGRSRDSRDEGRPGDRDEKPDAGGWQPGRRR